MVLLGCGDATGVAVNDLQGTWNATEFLLTNAANTSQTVELISQGFALTFTIGAGGSLTATIEAMGMQETETGTISTSGNSVTITLESDPSTGTISRDGDTITMNLTTGVEWDFDDDNSDEPATGRLVMRRTG